MPRLSHPRITKGDAINALMGVYWSDPAFVEEAEKISLEHNTLLQEYAIEVRDFWASSKKSPLEHYEELLGYFGGGKDPTPAGILNHGTELNPTLMPCGNWPTSGSYERSGRYWFSSYMIFMISSRPPDYRKK